MAYAMGEGSYSKTVESMKKLYPKESNAYRDEVIESVAVQLAMWYPDNANTGAFCAAIRSMKAGSGQK